MRVHGARRGQVKNLSNIAPIKGPAALVLGRSKIVAKRLCSYPHILVVLLWFYMYMYVYTVYLHTYIHGMCNLQFELCAIFSLSYVRDLVRVS